MKQNNSRGSNFSHNNKGEGAALICKRNRLSIWLTRRDEASGTPETGCTISEQGCGPERRGATAAGKPQSLRCDKAHCRLNGVVRVVTITPKLQEMQGDRHRPTSVRRPGEERKLGYTGQNATINGTDLTDAGRAPGQRSALPQAHREHSARKCRELHEAEIPQTLCSQAELKIIKKKFTNHKAPPPAHSVECVPLWTPRQVSHSCSPQVTADQ